MVGAIGHVGKLIESGRRAVVRCAFLALGIAALPSIAVADPATEVRVVHQRTDFSASRAEHMFRFEPQTLRLEPGEAVAFMNSLGDHTVRAQKGLWPDGVTRVDIRGRARTEVVFDTPGLYGITCARHGRYGMSMLIAVGEEGLEAARNLDIEDIPATDMARRAYEAQRVQILADGS
ncbi:MAG: plastocyanin/azurin family copper-binding protein [Pseudomonadota bacterium]